MFPNAGHQARNDLLSELPRIRVSAEFGPPAIPSRKMDEVGAQFACQSDVADAPTASTSLSGESLYAVMQHARTLVD